MRTLTFARARARCGTHAADSAFMRECRRELGLRQPMVAALCGRSVSVYADYEKGRLRVPPIVRARLVELLQWKRTGVAPAWATPFEKDG